MIIGYKGECRSMSKKENGLSSSQWFKLDNAGKLYPAIRSSTWSSLYRLTISLYQSVNPEILQKAVESIRPRFPSFFVQLRKGFFWYYLEENPQPFTIFPDRGYPCKPLKLKENHQYLFRVLYYQNTISVEFFHALTDGTGAMIFTKTLIAQYLRLLGIDIPVSEGILALDFPPSLEEVEDAYSKLPLPTIKNSRKESKAFLLSAKRNLLGELYIISGIIPLSDLLTAARAHHATITEYIVSTLIFTIYQTQQHYPSKKKKPVKVSVPVNMRSFFPTSTLRNFAYFINPGIHPGYGHYTFEEVLKEVQGFMKYYLRPKFLFSSIATNVASEKNLFIRLAPLPIKNLIMQLIFIQTGEKTVTTTFTNVGSFLLPPQMESHVKDFELVLGPAYTPRSNISGISYKDSFKITFSRNTNNPDIEKPFFQFLIKQGLPVKIQSNLKE